MNRRDDTETGGHVGPLLDAYRTGELDTSARAEIESHLADCERCREELAALGPWAASIERGYAALRESAREMEPDWASQRAAVVARTSGRRASAPKRWGFRSWAPQVALVAVAALIVGVVWRERTRGPAEEPVATTSAPAPAARSEGEADRFAQSPRDEGAARQAAEPPAAPEAAPPGLRQAAPPVPPAAAPEERRDALADRDVAPDAVAKAAPEVAAEAAPDEAAVARERREADEPALAEGVPLGAVARSEAQVRAQERFERDARAALAAQDTAAARRALAFWRDSLASESHALGAVDSARQAALADSLRELAGPPE